MSEIQNVNTVVVGAGAVGLAVARAIAQTGVDVWVLEQHGIIGSETSARNSEVIHAGMYYPTHSLKASLCVRGNALLYGYLKQKGVNHRQLGKLIVATDDTQLDKLRALHQQAMDNGVPGMHWLSAAQAQQLEPQLQCVAALHSETTGIVDSHGYMLALQGDIEAAGGMVVCHATVTRAQVNDGGTLLDISTPDGDVRVQATWLINCAGLHATQLAHDMVGFPRQYVPTPYYAKGNYYSLAQPSPFKRLIYPLPFNGGLGVHVTLDLGGQTRFGPDVQWLDIEHPQQIDYTVQAGRAQVFYEQIRRYWPHLKDGDLIPAYSGVRPKISGPDAQASDFVISTPNDHGVPGVVQLFGIESPGLTASMAIAEHVQACM